MKQKQAAFLWWPVFVSYPFLSVTDRIDKQKEVCRNARCTFFFVHYYTNRLIFFMLRKFADLFDLCVPNI